MSSSSSHTASHRVSPSHPSPSNRPCAASTRPLDDTNRSINQSPLTNRSAGRYASRPDFPRAVAGRGRRVRSLVRPRETSTGRSTFALDFTVARLSIVRRVEVCARVVRRVDIMMGDRGIWGSGGVATGERGAFASVVSGA